MAKIKKRTFKGIKKKGKEQLPKNSQKIPEKPQSSGFPKNHRFITEKTLWLGIFIFLILLGIVWEGKQFIALSHKRDAILQKRGEVASKITKWQLVIAQHPDYRDGYFTLALLEYQLGNTQEAEKYVDKTLQLDPNFAEAQRLRRLLGK